MRCPGGRIYERGGRPIVSTTRGWRASLFSQSHEAAVEHLQAAENELSHRKILQFKGDKSSRSVCPGLRGPAGRAPLGRRFSTRNAPYYGDTGGCRIYGRYVPPATGLV